MSVRVLVSAIEADPVKQERSYTLMKEALLGSYGMTKWQMAYSLLDHPDLGDRRPSPMMAEMLSLRFETTAPDSLFLALFLRRLPASIRDHLAAKITQRRQRWRHMQIFSGTPGVQRQSQRSQIRSLQCRFAPLRPAAAPSLLTVAPGRPIAATAAAVAANRPANPLPDEQVVRKNPTFATFTRSGGLTPTAAGQAVSGRKTRLPPWAAQCSRRPHLPPGFGI